MPSHVAFSMSSSRTPHIEHVMTNDGRLEITFIAKYIAPKNFEMYRWLHFDVCWSQLVNWQRVCVWWKGELPNSVCSIARAVRSQHHLSNGQHSSKVQTASISSKNLWTRTDLADSDSTDVQAARTDEHRTDGLGRILRQTCGQPAGGPDRCRPAARNSLRLSGCSNASRRGRWRPVTVKSLSATLSRLPAPRAGL